MRYYLTCDNIWELSHLSCSHVESRWGWLFWRDVVFITTHDLIPSSSVSPLSPPSLCVSLIFPPSLSFFSLSGSISEWWLQDIVATQYLLTAWAGLLDICNPHVKVWNGDTPTIRRPTNRVFQKLWTGFYHGLHPWNEDTLPIRALSYSKHTINQFFTLLFPTPSPLSLSLSPCYLLCTYVLTC